MLRFNGHRVLVFAASCLLGLAASTAMADGYGRGGLYGGRYGGRVGGIGYGSHLYGGGYPIGRSQLGYGGYGYGFARGGFARGGVSISIGGGYPYGFGGYGYRGLGYPFYPGFGSAYLPYRSYVPYAYPGYLSTRPDYAPNALYRPRYDRAPPRNYIYPDGQRYSAAKPAVPSNSDLKPGMILPDGSRVISVGPLDAPLTSRHQLTSRHRLTRANPKHPTVRDLNEKPPAVKQMCRRIRNLSRNYRRSLMTRPVRRFSQV